MSHSVNIVVEDDELELLDTILATVDFYGDGYDDLKPATARLSGEVFAGLVQKIKDALQGT